MLSVKTRRREVKIGSGGDTPEFGAVNWTEDEATARQAKVAFLSWKMSSRAEREREGDKPFRPQERGLDSIQSRKLSPKLSPKFSQKKPSKSYIKKFENQKFRHFRHVSKARDNFRD